MSDRVLFVDDEQNVLDALRRLLRRSYEFDTANSGSEALAMLADNDYAVIVSDMRMPGMAGDEFLAKAHVEQPDAIQMILSGQADLTSTVAAVNDGAIFRFLMKPVAKDVLTHALDAALRQYRLARSERELLEDTLSGAVEALTEVLGLVSPAATRRTNHVVDMVRTIAPAAGLEQDWQLRLAALLSGVGFAAIPQDVVDRSEAGSALTAAEAEMVARHPHVTAQLLDHIPRLEGVSAIITGQAGATEAPAELAPQIQVLDLAVEMSHQLMRGRELDAAVEAVRDLGTYPAELLDVFAHDHGRATVVEERPLAQIHVGMVLRSDVYSETDVILASSMTPLTKTLLERMRNYADGVGIREPILVEFEVGGPFDHG